MTYINENKKIIVNVNSDNVIQSILSEKGGIDISSINVGIDKYNHNTGEIEKIEQVTT